MAEACAKRPAVIPGLESSDTCSVVNVCNGRRSGGLRAHSATFHVATVMDSAPLPRTAATTEVWSEGHCSDFINERGSLQAVNLAPGCLGSNSTDSGRVTTTRSKPGGSIGRGLPVNLSSERGAPLHIACVTCVTCVTDAAYLWKVLRYRSLM